jgi:xylose dehydrogenase (NAD/NADP)
MRLQTELDGGALMAVGCDCAGMTRLLAGEPELAVATQVDGPTGIDNRFAGLLTFPRLRIRPRADAFVAAVGSYGTVRALDPFLCGAGESILTSDRAAAALPSPQSI